MSAWTTADLLDWSSKAGACDETLLWLSGRDQSEPAEVALRAARDEWREWTALRLPADQLGWAATDMDTDIRCLAAERLPVEQLAWATADRDRFVRELAAERLPVEQLAWALADPAVGVRAVAASRLRAAGMKQKGATT
jgi:hypothetical protein